MPFAAYIVFWIDKPNQVSTANVPTFLRDRILMLIKQVILLQVPLLTIIYLAIEVTGTDWIVPTVVLLTLVIEFIYIVVCPCLCARPPAKHELMSQDHPLKA